MRFLTIFGGVLIALHGLFVALAAEGFVLLGLAEHDLAVALDDAVADVGERTAAHADGMDLEDVVGDGEQAGHGAEGFAAEVEVEAGDDDADAAVGEFVADGDDAVVEELGFVDADDFAVAAQQEDALRGVDGCGHDAGAFVADDFFFAVTDVDRGLEDLDALAGKLGAAHAADEFLSLSREHRAADDFDAACADHFSASEIEFCHGIFVFLLQRYDI